MSRSSIVNQNPSSDGYIFSKFVIAHFDPPHRTAFPTLSKLIVEDKFSPGQLISIQRRLGKLKRPELWELLEPQLSHYIEAKTMKVSVADLMLIKDQLKDLQKEVTELKSIVKKLE